MRRTHIEYMSSALPPIGDRRRRYAQRVSETGFAVALLCGGIFVDGRQAKSWRAAGGAGERRGSVRGVISAFCRASPYSQDLSAMFLICSIRYDLIFPVPPDRGRSHETHANGEGCGA